MDRRSRLARARADAGSGLVDEKSRREGPGGFRGVLELASGLLLALQVVEHREALLRRQAFMHHPAHRFHHRDRVLALEDVAAHVHAARALLDGVVAHLQRVELRQLLATRDHDRHRAAAGDRLKAFVRVVALHHVRAELRHDARGEAEILRVASHRTAHGHHAHHRDAVTGTGIDEIRQVFQALALVSAADEDLHGQKARVETDGLFDVQRGGLIGERLEAGATELGFFAVDLAFPFFKRAHHGGATGSAQGDGLLRGSWDDAALNAAGEHEAVGIGLQGKNGLIDTLQAGGGALEVTVVKGEHHGAAVFRIEDLAEAILETPVVLVGTFEEEARRLLGRVEEVFLFLLVSSGGGDVGHGG